MKFYILILIVFICAACGAGKPPVNNAADERLKEKNKLTAARNEMTALTSLAQKLEQQGRDLQAFRDGSGSAEGARQCNEILEDRRKGLAEFEERVNALPDNYKAKLLPVVGEINECLSCAKKGLDDCKRARASINQLIKELYP